MKYYIILPCLLAAALLAASGVAHVTHGWVLPRNRRTIHRPRIHGWGQLIAAFALFCQVFFGLMISDIDIRQWGTLSGSALLLTGLVVMMIGQRPGRTPEKPSTP
ncbi:hypothetical protein ACIQNU_40780 [Streptomyces sp. NPDC091292]|uniref:hypothetical protein n=1 Tax=Streptomyces sp. NPDC091292 TaxID=3365991 RepID=UPI00380ACDC7